MTGIVALLLFAFFALVGYAVSGWAQDREEAKEALGRRLTTMTGASVGAASAALMKDRRLSRIGLFNAILQHLDHEEPGAGDPAGGAEQAGGRGAALRAAARRRGVHCRHAPARQADVRRAGGRVRRAAPAHDRAAPAPQAHGPLRRAAAR